MHFSRPSFYSLPLRISVLVVETEISDPNVTLQLSSLAVEAAEQIQTLRLSLNSRANHMVSRPIEM